MTSLLIRRPLAQLELVSGALKALKRLSKGFQMAVLDVTTVGEVCWELDQYVSALGFAR